MLLDLTHFRSGLVGVGFSLESELESYKLKCRTKSLEVDFTEVQDKLTWGRLS